MWLNMQRYSELHGITRRTVYRWVSQNLVKFKRVQRTVFIWEGEYEPTTLERIEKKIDDIRHATMKTNV